MRGSVKFLVINIQGGRIAKAMIYPGVKDDFEGLGWGAKADFGEVLGVQVICSRMMSGWKY